MSATLQRVILSYPTAVNLTETGAPRSWIQLARVGKFVSKRYGTFSITRADLAQMLHNFTTVTPKAPTELPVDYDHKSMDVRHPLDGIAAGWMKRLELRNNGDTLWAEVEWTPKAAEAIANGEYRYISPSFVKGHVYKDGSQIGTTLLAAAITNHPFLEGMAAVTLNTPAIQAVNFSAPLQDLVAVEDGALSFSTTIGQRVTVDPQHARTSQHVGVTFEIIRVDGMEGDDSARVWLKNAATGELSALWYRAEELQPARAQNPDPGSPEKREDPMKPEERIMARAQALAAERQINLSAAVKLASAEDAAAARAYLDHPEPIAEEPSSPVVNLRRDDGEALPALVARVAHERCNGDQVQAYRVVAAAFPDLVREYSDGTTL
jgi:hypothetical protein